MAETKRRHTRKGRIGGKKGTSNKPTMTFRAAVLEAFHRMGGVEALAAWGKENPAEFHRIYGRLFPSGIPTVEKTAQQRDEPERVS